MIVGRTTENRGTADRRAVVRLLLLCAAPCTVAEAQDAGSWTERISTGGDLRLRYESVERQPGADDNRYRYRARLEMLLDATDRLEFGFRLATGNGSPTSRNLDFGESFELDNIRIDRAYAAYSVNDALRLVAGKMKSPVVRPGESALMWDSDITPEGAAARIDAGMLFATVSGFVFNDRAQGPDATLVAVQGGIAYPLSKATTLTAGVGWFDFLDVAGHSVLHGSSGLGNSLDVEGNYLHDYDVIDLFIEFQSSIGKWPVTLFSQWAQNTAAPAADTAYAVGARLGRANEPGDAEFSWEWRATEADALVAIFTDSDFAAGRSDSRGHELAIGYRLNQSVVLGATAIFSEYGHFAGAVTDFDRLMFDIEFSFQ